MTLTSISSHRSVMVYSLKKMDFPPPTPKDSEHKGNAQRESIIPQVLRRGKTFIMFNY